VRQNAQFEAPAGRIFQTKKRADQGTRRRYSAVQQSVAGFWTARGVHAVDGSRRRRSFSPQCPRAGATILFRDPRSTDHAPVAEIL
jgi:hypothetical protein